MKKIALALVLLYTLTQAKECTLTSSNDMNVTWKAYKTFAKLGVGGAFTAVKYTPHVQTAKTFNDLLVGSTVEINISQINTNNPDRDKTLVTMFFNQLKGKTIEGKILKVTANTSKEGKILLNGVVKVLLTMNEKTLTIPMQYNYENALFSATGVIDLFDFQAQSALASINKSCYDLHKGKTWNDVSISFNTPITATNCMTADSNTSK